MKIGNYIWLAFLGIFVAFVIFGIATNDEIRESFRQQGSFRELPRKTQILIGLGIWLFLVIVIFAVCWQLENEEARPFLPFAFLIMALVWLILMIISYVVWKKFEPEEGLTLIWMAFFILWPPVVIWFIRFLIHYGERKPKS